MTKRRHALAIVAVAVFLTAACGEASREAVRAEPTPEKVKIPRAERAVFDFAKDPGLTAVGKLSFLGGTWCTVALVSENVAVTAGHCFLVAKFKFDRTKPMPDGYTNIRFRPKGSAPIEDVQVKRVLKESLKPDFAIIELSRPIPSKLIRPFKISTPTPAEMRQMRGELGCAGFNGDEELGSGGMLMTISREVEIVDDSTAPERLDTNCYATYGGSGGPFFRRAKGGDFELLGVVWGVTDVEYDENGKLIPTENVTTSVTATEVFAGELRRFGIGS